MILPLLLHTEWKFPSHGEAVSVTGHNPCGENVKLVSQLLVMTQLTLSGKDLKNTLLFLKKNL